MENSDGRGTIAGGLCQMPNAADRTSRPSRPRLPLHLIGETVEDLAEAIVTYPRKHVRTSLSVGLAEAGPAWVGARQPGQQRITAPPVGPRPTPRHHRRFQPAAQGRRAAAAAARRRWCPRWPRKHSKVLLYCRGWSTPHLRHPGQPEAKHFANELQDVLQLPKQHMR